MIEEFNLSEDISKAYELLDDTEVVRVKTVKELIKEGDKIFFSKDYGDEVVTNMQFYYASDRWKEFKKLLGDKLI